MLLRTLLPALLLLPALAPRQADACSPSIGFTISEVYPAAGESVVPTDGVIVVAGESWSKETMSIEVRLAGELVEGTLTGPALNRYVWRASAPLLPDTQYAVHIEAEGDVGVDVRDFEFTTGAEPAPAPSAPQEPEVRVEAYEQEIRECVVKGDAGECGACLESKVVAVESRMRMVVSVDAPSWPFDGFYGSTVRSGWTATALDATSGTLHQSGIGESMEHTIDLGLAGSWEGDQACAQIDIVDPLGQSASSAVECVDITGINVVPDAETDAGSSGGDESGDESSGGDEGPGQDIELRGCNMRGTGGPLGPGALLLLGLGLLRRRR